jgi:hypothetical protein
VAASAEDADYIHYGDVDKSGGIPDINDVVLLQKIVAGWKVPEADRKAADVDGDGDISVFDITLLQKFIAGWRVTLGPEKESFNGHTYQAVDKSMTWSDAKSYCEKMGGHLVTITSESEEEFIEQLIDRHLMKHYHIGLTDDRNSNYSWVTGEPFSYNKNIKSADGEWDQYTYVLTSRKMGGTLIHVWGDHDDVIRHDDWDYTYTGFVCEWEPSELSAV